MNRRRPSRAECRRSLQRPTTSGTAKPAAELTIITTPIKPGAYLMSASNSGRYVVVTVRTRPAPTAATANTARYAAPRPRTSRGSTPVAPARDRRRRRRWSDRGRSSRPPLDEPGRSEGSRLRPAGCLARIVEHVCRLEPDEAAVRARERERLGSAVDGVAAEDVVERDALVPPVPLLMTTEGTGDPGVPASQEIKDRLRRRWLLPRGR
jgi:hypothetical protein